MTTYAIKNFNAHISAEKMMAYLIQKGLVVSNVGKSLNRNGDKSAYFTVCWLGSKGTKFATVRVSDHVSHNSTAHCDCVGQARVDAAIAFLTAQD